MDFENYTNLIREICAIRSKKQNFPLLSAFNFVHLQTNYVRTRYKGRFYLSDTLRGCDGNELVSVLLSAVPPHQYHAPKVTPPIRLRRWTAANQSYIIAPETFNCINTMEFLNDRFASLMVSWDLNGKIFNRIPLINRLHWREYVGVRMLWGTLTDKNNPLLAQNQGNSRLMYFPDGVHVMDPNRPYAEIVLGIHNIFKIWHIEYVRRLNYNDLPTSPKWGMRYVIALSF